MSLSLSCARAALAFAVVAAVELPCFAQGPEAGVLAATTATASAGLAGDDNLARLAAAPGALRWNVVRDGERYGHAEILIPAPLAAVRAQVLDFSRYTEFDPGRFQKSKVVGRRPGETDVYMQVPIMNGMVTLWDVTRFSSPVVVAPGVERVEGRLVKGNFKDMRVVWTMRAVGSDRTVLSCDLLLVLNVSVPQELADFHHRESAAKAVEALRARLTAK